MRGGSDMIVYGLSMFFQERSTQAEYFDQPLQNISRTAERYAELRRLNRIFRFSHPFRDVLPGLIGEQNCSQLTLLDLGAGDGSLGEELTNWAARRGWQWQVTNLDLDPQALQLSKNPNNVIGDMRAVPFADNSFDVVITSQTTHHLTTDADVIQHFREAWRVARRGVLISDLHRNAGLYALVWASSRLLFLSDEIKFDGPLSVRRGFHLPEWRRFAAEAGISNASVSLYYGTRILLAARKS